MTKQFDLNATNSSPSFLPEAMFLVTVNEMSNRDIQSSETYNLQWYPAFIIDTIEQQEKRYSAANRIEMHIPISFPVRSI